MEWGHDGRVVQVEGEGGGVNGRKETVVGWGVGEGREEVCS